METPRNLDRGVPDPLPLQLPVQGQSVLPLRGVGLRRRLARLLHRPGGEPDDTPEPDRPAPERLRAQLGPDHSASDRDQPLHPLHPEDDWWARWSLAIYVGYYVGVNMVQKLHGEVLPQMAKHDRSVHDGGNGWLGLVNNLILFVGVLAVLSTSSSRSSTRGPSAV